MPLPCIQHRWYIDIPHMYTIQMSYATQIPLLCMTASFIDALPLYMPNNPPTYYMSVPYSVYYMYTYT
jgi:hypothetical protein